MQLKTVINFVLIMVVMSCIGLKEKKNTNNQKNEIETYDLINGVFYEMISIDSVNKDKFVYLEEIPIDFSILKQGEKPFFSKKNFEDYKFPTLGVDKVKIIELINNVDFDYCNSQKSEIIYWNRKKIKLKVKLVNSDFDMNKSKVIHRISVPIFDKDKKYAFVIYSSKCKIVDSCSGLDVKIFKRHAESWKYFTKIPVSLH